MKEAVEAVLSGNPLKTTAARFDVPRNTLRRKVEAKRQGLYVEKKLGKQIVLSTEQEDELVQLLIRFERRLFALSMQDLRSLIFQFIKKLVTMRYQYFN